MMVYIYVGLCDIFMYNILFCMYFLGLFAINMAKVLTLDKDNRSGLFCIVALKSSPNYLY